MAVAKSLLMKHVEASESNKARILIILEFISTIIERIKQGEALEIRIGPLINDSTTFSNCMVPTLARHLRFLIQHPPPLIGYSLKHFKPYVI